MLFEFDRDHPEELQEIVKGGQLAASSKFNVCVLRSTIYRFGYRSSIHIWLSDDDVDDASLMIMPACIIVGHPDWRRAEIQLFTCFVPAHSEQESTRLNQMVQQGRLPISSQKITAIPAVDIETMEREIRSHSAGTDLVILGLPEREIQGDPTQALLRNRELNDVLFVTASENISTL